MRNTTENNKSALNQEPHKYIDCAYVALCVSTDFGSQCEFIRSVSKAFLTATQCAITEVISTKYISRWSLPEVRLANYILSAKDALRQKPLEKIIACSSENDICALLDYQTLSAKTPTVTASGGQLLLIPFMTVSHDKRFSIEEIVESLTRDEWAEFGQKLNKSGIAKHLSSHVGFDGVIVSTILCSPLDAKGLLRRIKSINPFEDATISEEGTEV